MPVRHTAQPGPAGPARIAADPAAFASFYRSHVVAVSRFLARRVADPHTVADLTVEVFIAAIDSAGGYRPGQGSERGWLYGIARHLISADRRRAARELSAASRLAARRVPDDDDIARLEERIDAETAGRQAIRALAGLPADERAVLELVAVDGLAVKDAAAVLGIQPGTARVRLYRARRAARAALAELAPAPSAGPPPARPAAADLPATRLPARHPPAGPAQPSHTPAGGHS